MRTTMSLCCGLLMATAAIGSEGSQVSPVRLGTTVECTVTVPNGVAAGEPQNDPNSYGNRQVSVAGLWPDGTIVFKPGGPGFLTRDGSLGMKFGWRRGAAGRLRIEGRRLDAPAAPLRSEVPDGYGDLGFQASYVIFPTPGCWEVTGRVSNASVTFVTKVTKIADGPGWRRDVQ